MTALTCHRDSGTDGVTREEALAKLISIRHHCFIRGALGRSAQDDFRQAFRTLNRVYVCMRDRPERHSDTNGRAASQFSRPCRPKPCRREQEPLYRPSVEERAVTNEESKQPDVAPAATVYDLPQ